MLKGEWATVRAVGTGPAIRSTHDMDVSEAGKIVIFGGMTANKEGDPVPYDDTFVLNVDGKAVWGSNATSGSGPSKREGHTITYIPDGDFFICFGGSDDITEQDFNDVYVLSSSLEWKKMITSGNGPAPRLNHAATAVGSDLYVFGGFVDGDAKNDLYKLDTTTFQWSLIKVANAPSRRCDHTITAVGTNLYVFGGRGGEATLYNDITCFDTLNHTWTTLEPSGQLPPERDFHSAVAFNDKIFIFGGAYEIESKDIFKYFNDVFAFDTQRGVWVKPSVSGTAPTVRWAHSACVFGNKMYVFGGTANDEDLNDCHALTIIDGGMKPAPRRKPAPAPTPVSKATLPQSFERTQAPDISYDVPNPAPALRRRVAPKPISEVHARDFERVESQMVQSIHDIFNKIQAEYKQIDQRRAELNADRDAFDKEKAENEELHESQQQSMRSLQEQHRSQTEDWIAKRRSENDSERRKIAEEWARVKAEEERLKGVEAQLKQDRDELDAEKTDFHARKGKMEKIMAQFQGLG
eukprot:m.47255 g.47255  ORF g.47255 m.47255 type:complete len:522 (-) comp7320_c0_seq1:258-1823(-)